MKKSLKILLVLSISIGVLTACGTTGNTNLKLMSELDIAMNFEELSNDDKVRFQEILKSTIQQENYLTPQVHDEFWGILLQNGEPTVENIKNLRKTMAGPSVDYIKVLYEDALLALNRQAPYKSKKREDLEKFFIDNELITDFRIQENEKFIENIAYGNPITTNGQEYVLDETAINNVLNNLEAVSSRLDDLFTR